MKKIYQHLSKNIILYLFTFSGILLYILFLFSSQDNDMFFEIMSGRDLLNGNFKTASHLNNFPIIVQQWLYAVCLALFDKLGYFGHISIVFIQNIILYIVSIIFVYNKTKNKKLAIYGSFFSILFCHGYLINIRPQIITMILLVIELIILDKYKNHNQNIKYLFLLIPILILSANFHQAVFLYHIMILIPYYIDKDYYIDWKLVSITSIFILCSLCTPYTINGSLYIFRTFLSKTYSLFNIKELESTNILSTIGIRLILLVSLTIWYIYKHKSNIYINTYVFIISLLTLINVRHFSVIYIAVLFVMCNIDLKKLCNTYVYIIFSCLMILSFIEGSVKSTDIYNYYGNVANIIEDKDATIYNSAMDLGGFLEYNGYTKVKVDSRCEAFSKENSGIDNVNYDLVAVSTGYKVDKDFNYSLMSDNEILNIVIDYDYIIASNLDYINRIAIDENGWNKIYTDNNYTIYKNIRNK